MITIRDHAPGSATELDAITAIYSHHVRHGRASFETEPPSADEMCTRLLSLVDAGYPVLVAILDEVVVGYAYAGPHKARAAYRRTVEDSIYVAPDMARRGVGRALLAALLEQVQAAGFHQVMAVIGDSANAASIELHRALGLRHIGTAREIGFKFGEYIDVVYMQLALQEYSPPDRTDDSV